MNNLRKVLLFSLLAAFAYTMASSYYFAYLLKCQNPERVMGNYLAVSSGDTFSYLGAMDNYQKEGTYYFINMQGEKTFAGRLPHYGSIYYVLSIFFTQKVAYDILVLLQIILHAISVVILALLAFRITQNKYIYWGVFLSYLFISYTSIWLLYLATESFSTSFLILFLFFYQKYTEAYRDKDLFIASLFLSLLVVLRPYFILLYLVIGIHFIFKYSLNLKAIFQKTLLTSITLVILLLPWVVRNYLVLERFIPLQENATAGYGYSKSELALRKYINAWGGSFIDWEPKEAGCYFIKNKSIQCEFMLPDYAISKSFSRADVEEVRQLFFILQDQHSYSLDVVVSSKFEALAQKYAQDKPVSYYLFSPLTRLKKFIIQSNTYNLPIHASFTCYNSLQGLYKIVQYLFYYILFGCGILGMLFFYLYPHRKWNVSAMHSIAFLYVIIFFPFILGGTEWRFMIQIFPILILWSGLGLHLTLSNKSKRT